MKRRALAQRLNRLDGGPAVVSGHVWCRLRIDGYRTQAEYDRYLAQALAQVPPGAAVFCFPELSSEEEWLEEVRRWKDGLSPHIHQLIGIFLKPMSMVAE